MSQHQMYLYLKLLLGLPIPALLATSPVCPCGKNHDFHGYHRLNCNQKLIQNAAWLTELRTILSNLQ
jgi:hypothetical protein